ncbi:MAG: DUF1800 domain-containing protein [Symploca sp. SIO3C6]|nr:DUF1800 domain-containing protein [Symploca sp. SIO3C6]
MKLKLRYLILAIILGVSLWWGLSSPRQAASLPSDAKVIHLLNRLSFGQAPGDIQQLKSMGIEAYIQSQLSPESIAQPPQLQRQLNQLSTLQLDPVELFREYDPKQQFKGKKPTEEERKMAGKQAQLPKQQAVEARLLRAVTSPRQLQELMVNFWFNHFNVFAQKGLTRLWVGAYEQQTIRPLALGNFRDLLGATARHPAMLFYLDNWQNTAPDSPGARGRFRGLNENYARELMELHTLGVDGGYTQKDVMTLAQILTGWGLDRNGERGDGSGFYFDSKRHDYSDKVFLGTPIKGSGITEVEQALDILASHKSTARHISYKLAQYFVADQPPVSLVDNLTQRFLATDGEISAVLETLFQSPEFWDSKYYGSKFKTPYEYVISAVRATGTEEPNLKAISGILNQLGMPIYGCRTPNGYQNTQQTWLNPDAMLRRVSFATSLASGRLNKSEPVNPVQLSQTLGNNFSAHTQKVINTNSNKLHAALILGSPEMMHK